MARNIDFNALKARTMGAGDDEEAVTVNTRALIDKVLARYSGEWTVLRELLQNAADASATRVTIKFETVPSTSVPAPIVADPTTSLKHVIAHHTLKRLLLTNNGIPFTSNDWSRLKRIAEGNPDETKIGAFGVGFYSVFSDCEEPFVSSGNKAIAFYWKGNSLFTRQLQLEDADASLDTSFVLDYRNTTSSIPALMPLCQFLASSLTFVGLESIELWIDDWNLLKLSKKIAPSVGVNIPKDVETKTADGLMKVASIIREVSQIDALTMRAVTWRPPNASSRFEGTKTTDNTTSLRKFFSRFTGSAATSQNDKAIKTESEGDHIVNEDLTSTTLSSVFLHTSTAHVRTSVNQTFARELERATKKPPPKSTTLAILTSSHNVSTASGGSDVLSSVLPSGGGKIFIGFPTHQTTGLNVHISAPSVIPTVERESIDLNARWVRTWNLELLRAAGIVCRIAWSAEMASLNERISSKISRSGKSKLPNEVLHAVLPEAIHTCNQFVFRESTPTSQVGTVIEDSFWTCSKNASLEVLSTCGIIPSHQVRIAPKDLSFMDRIPVLPEELMTGSKDFVKRLTDFGLVTDITVSDIKKELEANALNDKQLEEFMVWITRQAAIGDIDILMIKSLLSAVVANEENPDGRPSRVLVLADIRCFVNPNRIPVDLPMPLFVMPFRYTKNFKSTQLESLGWRELQVDTWVRWLIENSGNRALLSLEQDMTQAASFSAQVLPVLSKQWDSLGTQAKSLVVELLQGRTVIPTKLGMKRPPETYFPSVRLFDDLPVVTGLNNVKEKFLSAIGVRKTVDLNVIFERLLNPAHPPVDEKGTGKKKWSHVDLIKYLSSVCNDIPAQDIEKLKQAKICTAEGDQSMGAGGTRYRVCELYEQDDALRELGLPLLYWPGRYSPTSAEGKFLTRLGLKKYPIAAELIQLMGRSASQNDCNLRDKALDYFIVNHVAHGYSSIDFSRVITPFLPVDGSAKLSTPNKCFTDEGASLFGFDLLRRDLHLHASKFGVKQHPPLHDCINLLTHSPPNSKKEATVLFKYFASRLGEINSLTAKRIGQASIVPIVRSDSKSKGLFEKPVPVRHAAPQGCYLGESEDYGEIFEFVDFGQEANLFLLACGSKRQPTKAEVASILVKEPAKISAKLQSPEKYLNLLRSIAESLSVIRKDRELFRNMQTAPFLLASRELPPRKSAQREKLLDLDDEDEEQSIKEWQLVSAADAIIVDDYTSFSLFKENILAAPQEESLEDMYIALGTPCLSRLVEEQARCGAVVADQRPALKLQKQIYERSRLFLHDMSRDAIRHDSKWLEKKLTVRAVQSLTLRRSLKGRNASHVEKWNAVVTQGQGELVLSICAGKFDFYQISQALVHLILTRPKLHSAVTFEMLLKTDLLELRTRGYNVERILRQKAAEARMAEAQRQQQLEEEQKRIQESEVAWRQKQDQQQEARKSSEGFSMPGIFPDSSGPRDSKGENKEETDTSQDRGSGGLFSNLTKRLGLDDSRTNSPFQSALQNIRDATTGNKSSAEPPPPYSVDDPKEPKVIEEPHNTVTSPHKLQSNLLAAVQKCRPHGSSSVYNQGEKDQVVETKSYCDERPGHDLVFAADGAHGIRIFVTKALGDKSAFLSQNSSGLTEFTKALSDCAKIFAVRMDSISIFYEPAGKTIAFNSQGSIFCNFHYFQQLHLEQLAKGGSREDSLVYWWVIFCHELAHNLVASHSSEHSFYTEGFVAQYFPKVAAKVAEYAAKDIRREQ
ncbi:hypothetical protein AJ80_08603 [Polytolypa hystricis UAMH7299]|uniref:Sacsin/Nov domain-containing protein n=1 Tax=Polytolypa hystricis (strain UAMH7299) TaxID=1447883 RepID=A0A2B7X547_POLH7|nr:hypothetical protein AJ80_08603 [Polytolypa hystricis UAMH7299]